jgi:hypothetical protein
MKAGTSVLGTFRTWRDVRLESAFGGKAEVRLWSRQCAIILVISSLCLRYSITVS